MNVSITYTHLGGHIYDSTLVSLQISH